MDEQHRLDRPVPSSSSISSSSQEWRFPKSWGYIHVHPFIVGMFPNINHPLLAWGTPDGHGNHWNPWNRALRPQIRSLVAVLMAARWLERKGGTWRISSVGQEAWLVAWWFGWWISQISLRGIKKKWDTMVDNLTFVMINNYCLVVWLMDISDISWGIKKKWDTMVDNLTFVMINNYCLVVWLMDISDISSRN